MGQKNLLGQEMGGVTPSGQKYPAGQEAQTVLFGNVPGTHTNWEMDADIPGYGQNSLDGHNFGCKSPVVGQKVPTVHGTPVLRP